MSPALLDFQRQRRAGFTLHRKIDLRGDDGVSGVTGLDHVIVLVDDLDRGEASMAALGFRPTPRGYHSEEMGTANATVVLHDGTYFEVLGIIAETETNRPIRAGLAEGRTLFGLAMKTHDAEAAQARFDGLRIGAGTMRAFSRPVDLPGGPRDASFRTAHLDESVTPGAYGFACEHLTPDVVWRPDYLDQPNAVTGIRRVVGVAADPGAAAAAWGRIAGLEPDGSGVAVGERRLDFVDPAEFGSVYGPPPPAIPCLAALVFATSDLERTHGALEAGDVDYRLDGDVLQAIAEGVVFRFENA